MSAIITAKCCCNSIPPDDLYSATKCPTYEVNQCAAQCGDCCSGTGTPSTIYFCGDYLSSIGFSPGSFSSLYCYYVLYKDCVYVINITSIGECPTEPPFPEPFNVGGFHNIVAAGGQPCCRPSGPVVPCVNDIIIDSFPYADPWGITNPVKISSNLEACVNVSGTIYALCGSDAGEWMSGGTRKVSHDTYQEVGKCFERGNPDTPLGGTCDRTTTGNVGLQKIGELQVSETWNPCLCIGGPGGAWYTKTVRKCYGVNECSGSKCWGYCGDPAGYAACVAYRNANDLCNGVDDPMESYDLDTRYTIIKSCKTYYDPPNLDECECDYYEDDAIRISFPMCYATNAGLDPFNPAQQTAIKNLYLAKVQVRNFCDNPCYVTYGDFGSVPASCLDICPGESNYHIDIFSGGAGEIAARINSKMGGKITAASLNQWFWFGTRQNTSACGGNSNQRPPHGPGDIMVLDRAVIDTAAWKVRVFIKGKSTRFRYCVSQVLGTNVSSGRATCMSNNAVSPAEWAAGMRPFLVMVKTNAASTTPRCECPNAVTVTDCSSVGTYDQQTVMSGAVVVPGYAEQFGSPCDSQWLLLGCKNYDCCYTSGCSCDDCGTCNECCECIGPFGFPAIPNCPPAFPDECLPETISGSCGCSIPSNQQITILP